MRETANAAGPRVEQYGHMLCLELPDVPVIVDGDAARLEQVFANLLENAAKYTPGGGSIWLALAVESGEAVIRVRDSGIGLAPDMLERIFDLFTQVDSSLARSGGGLGLGLTVVRRLLELHGGRIEVQSAGLGQGSEFIVRLGLMAVPEDMPIQPQKNARTGLGPKRRRNVLIVDDNADAAQSMAELLGKWGHEVAVANNAPEALALAKSFKPDVALVDIGLPGMNGYELAKRWRASQDGQSVKLVAMTGYGRAEDRATGHEAGFDAHLVKPADLTELENLLAGNA